MLIAYVVGSILVLIIIGRHLHPDRRSASCVIVFSIIAAVAANQGQLYTYPLSIKFVS